MKKSINKNVFYNTIKTVFGIIFPLITFPYISRVLGVDNVGKIDYSASIISYFTLLSNLGTTNYAVRECAKIREDRAVLDDTASQIFSINLLSCALSYAALFVLLGFSAKLAPYRIIILLQGVSILFGVLGADWINTASEDFQYVAIRTVAVQLITLVLMFIFVHKPEDYIAYAVLCTVAGSGGFVANMFYRRRFCTTRFTLKIDWKRHLPPIIWFFSIVLSQTIYTNSDSTIIGLISGDRPVGLYNTAVKIYNIVNRMIVSVTMVVMPQLAQLFVAKNYREINRLVKYALGFIIVLGLPCIVGIETIAPHIIYTIAGPAYMEASWSLRILGIALAFALLEGFVGSAIMVPSGREKIYLIASFVGAGTNLVLNLIFIPIFGIEAAAATTAFSECISLIIQLRHVEREIRVTGIFGMIKVPVIGSAFICAVGIVMSRILSNSYLITAATVFVGAVGYGALLIIMKDQFFMQLAGPVLRKMKLIK